MGKSMWPDASLRILCCLGKGLAEQAKVTVPGAAFVIGTLSGRSTNRAKWAKKGIAPKRG